MRLAFSALSFDLMAAPQPRHPLPHGNTHDTGHLIAARTHPANRCGRAMELTGIVLVS